MVNKPQAEPTPAVREGLQAALAENEIVS